MFASYASMTSGEHGAANALEASPGDAWAELCGFGGEDEEPEDHDPGYASLMGVAARKPKKQPVLVLDPEVAERAAQVMEINAGQLIVNPDKSAQGFAWPGLDPLRDEEDEESLDALEDEGDEEFEDEGAQAPVGEWAGAGEDAEIEFEAPAELLEPVWWGTMEDPAEPFAAEPAIETCADEDREPASMPDEPVFDLPAFEQGISEAAPVPTFGEFGGHMGDDLAAPSPEPETPRHELRALVAQRARPRISRTPRLRVWARRVYRLVRQILA